jgi:hypothetical protein
MKKGTSLVELSISLAVSALLLISMLKVFALVNSFAFRIAKEAGDSLAIFRTLDMLERDLKLATGNFSCSVDFVSFDAVVDGKTRRIRYYMSKQRIMRRSGNSYNEVMEFGQSAFFTGEGDSVRLTIDGRELLFRAEGDFL